MFETFQQRKQIFKSSCILPSPCYLPPDCCEYSHIFRLQFREAQDAERRLNDDSVVAFGLQLLLSAFKRNRLGAAQMALHVQVRI